MNFISPPDAPSTPTKSTDAAAPSQGSFGRMFPRAIVVLIGIVAGFFIALFIGLANGWIPIC